MKTRTFTYVLFIMVIFLLQILVLPIIATTSSNTIQTINIDVEFSDVSFENYDDGLVIIVDECNFNVMKPGYPVIPAFVSIHELPFGTTIESFEISHGEIREIPVLGSLAFDSLSHLDSLIHIRNKGDSTLAEFNIFPETWVTYHTGAGLVEDEHQSFIIIRVYPSRYSAVNNTISYLNQISIIVTYHTPDQPILTNKDIYDFLIISPNEFLKDLQPIIDHKNAHGIKTRLVGLNEVYEQMFWNGRDSAEKIKYFIKHSIENWGIRHVLLVGGHQGQTNTWYHPVRYSYVVPPDEQEYPEQNFLSDLYFADIYDSNGNFSNWDSNHDDRFSVWNETFRETMDLYPDVYLGRIPCRNRYEVKTMVNKIITYESEKAPDSWFKNLLLVAGDSYVNEGENYNEGEIISEKAIELMPGFNPLRVYSSIDDINRETVNAAFNQGAGFAYFCGHGSASSWSTHFPPATNDRENWTTGYEVEDMIYLRNKEKQPITIVGGCHNGQFDITIPNSIKQGLKIQGLRYFIGRFWFDGWVSKCWGWWLTSKPNGGAIATIANTGLGTHGEEDTDHNGIIDYLEVLDGWMELRFLELHGTEHKDNLGEIHTQTMIEYLHWFLGNHEKMDTKMVQQWQLFGDPSLKIGGYN